MIVLDTDHVVILKYSQGTEYATLSARMAASLDQDFVTTCVTAEEQLRGWLALINRTRDMQRQVSAYDELNKLIDYLARWPRLEFTPSAADRFEQLRRQKVRIGTMDLKIASIALDRDITLLSANMRDYQKVPSLRVEDWSH